MHGLGNDFVVIKVDSLQPLSPSLISRLSDRRTGIGFDQLLWLEPPRTAEGDIFYRIFNGDGSEAEQCGNGARCIAQLIGDSDHRSLILEHVGGKSQAIIETDGTVSVEIGIPDFTPAHVPFIAESTQSWYAVAVGEEMVNLGIVSLGNPHAVLPVDNVDSAPVAHLGPQLEKHSRFPNRANIGFMQVVTAERIRLRVFERGVGETRACGTGACAAVVVGQRSGQLAERVVVELPGGEVTVRWEGPGTPVWLTGNALTVYEGTVDV